MTGGISTNELLDFDARRLRQLAAAQCDDNISDSKLDELEAMLERSTVARTMYLRYVGIHAALDWEITSRGSVADLLPSTQASERRARGSDGRKYPLWTVPTIAVALMIAVAAVMMSRRADAPQKPPNHVVAEVPTRAATTDVRQVAVITELGPNAQWAVTPREGSAPTDLRERDVVCVTEGQIQVTFECGAVVTLYAPAMMEAVSPMKGRAIRGKLAANVVDGAQGFTIETPQATIVDLGTVFGIEVGNEGATDVVVFKGAVDLHFDMHAGTETQSAPQRLTSGEAMRIDKGGTPSRIVSISSDHFSSESSNGTAISISRPVLISNVTDNIDRELGSWNYYEIVHGGMREDAKAFVDRVAHEWNGLDQTGIPKFLLGGDYVKTFNNDKYSHDLELFVTIDHPCRLYILIDDRVPPPAWLTKQFHDTGFDIGLDVGPFYRLDGVLVDDRVPGVGPGVLVDDVFSIWECKIDHPQVVHLAATEANSRYINMYGIVAVQLEEDK